MPRQNVNFNDIVCFTEGYTTDNDYAGVYVEADEPKHDDTAPTSKSIHEILLYIISI